MVAIESTDDYADTSFHSELIDLDRQNPDGSWGTVVEHYRLVKIGDAGRVEPLDQELVFDSRAEAQTIADSIPYAQQVDYDTLIREAGRGLTAKYTLEEISPGSYDLRLRFHGHGKIHGYLFPENRPWQSRINRIREVVIEKGITEVSDKVLSNMPALERLSWPHSTQGIGRQQLASCPALREVSFTGTPPNQVPICTSAELAELAKKYPGFNAGQLDEIGAGIREDLTPKELAVYAKPEFDATQMSALRYCVSSGLSWDHLAVIANPAFGAVQMDVIRASFQCGMTMEQVNSIAQPGLTPNQMLDRYWDIRNTPTPEETLEAERLEQEFWEMDDFLKDGGNIADLADLYERDLDLEP